MCCAIQLFTKPSVSIQAPELSTTRCHSLTRVGLIIKNLEFSLRGWFYPPRAALGRGALGGSAWQAVRIGGTQGRRGLAASGTRGRYYRRRTRYLPAWGACEADYVQSKYLRDTLDFLQGGWYHYSAAWYARRAHYPRGYSSP